MEGDDVGVRQAGNGVGFADETLPEGFVAGYVRLQNFERFLAGEARVLYEIDLAHSSSAELSHGGVAGELVAHCQWRWADLIGLFCSATSVVIVTGLPRLPGRTGITVDGEGGKRACRAAFTRCEAGDLTRGFYRVLCRFMLLTSPQKR